MAAVGPHNPTRPPQGRNNSSRSPRQRIDEDVSPLELALLVVAGLAAGSINGAVGSGSLVTLPVLLAMGLGPASAVTTNTIAMVLSAFGGVMAYRKELKEDLPRLWPLIITSTLGGIAGSILLLTTPASAIRIVVPILITFALLLVIFQPMIAKWVRGRIAAQEAAVALAADVAAETTEVGGSAAFGSGTPAVAASPAGQMAGTAVGQSSRNPYGGWGLRASIIGCSIYGGYFAAAQGVILLGVLGAFTGQPLGRVNGVKNLLTLTVNSTAAIMFTVAAFTGNADVIWPATAAIAAGAIVGGYAGGHLAKAVPAWVLRAIIVVVASIALIRELF
jgi:uncharacterized membrane protein YfcA